eukprot:92696-Karenia_brevis.AAC.2
MEATGCAGLRSGVRGRRCARWARISVVATNGTTAVTVKSLVWQGARVVLSVWLWSKHRSEGTRPEACPSRRPQWPGRVRSRQ